MTTTDGKIYSKSDLIPMLKLRNQNVKAEEEEEKKHSSLIKESCLILTGITRPNKQRNLSV